MPASDNSITRYSSEINNLYSKNNFYNKDDHKIDLSQVQALAEKSLTLLQSYEKNPDQSLKGRVKTYETLNNSLKEVAKRINESKSFLKWLLSFFIYTSSEEKSLAKTQKKVNKLFKAAKKQEHRLWVGESLILRFLNYFFGISIKQILSDNKEQHFTKTKGKIKEAAFRVVGDNRISSENLEGSQASKSISGVKRDVEAFKTLFKAELDENDLSSLNTAIQNLEKSEKLADAFELIGLMENLPAKYKGWVNGKSKEAEKLNQRLIETSQTIIDAINDLEIGECLPIPGGYLSESGGHAVVYNIKRTSADDYTFTVINTGSGVGNFDTLLSQVWNSIVSGEFRDYEVRGLSLKQLTNISFFNDLMLNKVQIVKSDPVKEMFKPIIKYLCNGDEKNIKQGRKHSIQTNGTCTHDSIMSWLESELDNDLFRCLELYMTKEGTKTLKQLKSDYYKPREHELHKEIDSLSAKHDGSIYKGVRVISKIEEFAGVMFDKRANGFEQCYRKQYANIAHQKMTVAETMAPISKKVQKLKKRATAKDDKVYLRNLANKVHKLRKNYCIISGQNVSVKPDKPGFFCFSKATNQAWSDFQTKLKKLHVKRKEAENPKFYEHIGQILAEENKKLIALKAEEQALAKKQKRLDAHRKIKVAVAA